MARIGATIVSVGCGASALADSGPSLIKYKGIAVTEPDVEAQVADVPSGRHARVLMKQERIDRIVDSLFVKRVLAERAEESSFAERPEVQRRVRLAKESKLAGIYLAHLVDKAAEGRDFEARARELYRAYPDRYRKPEKVDVSHILISTEDRTEEEAATRAEKVHDLLVDGEHSFGEVAREYSDSPRVGDNEGHLGFVSREKVVEPFAEKAFAMDEKGAISEPVKTQYGYHVIQYHGRKGGDLPAFEEIKGQIIEKVKKDFRARKKEEILYEIRTAPEVETNRDAIEDLRVEPQPRQ